jgi:uncharacterized protein
VVFLDAGPLVAYFHESDVFHRAALAGFAALERSEGGVFSTSLCVAEAVTVLARATGDHLAAAHAGRKILEWQMEIARPTLAEERRALALMETYAEKRVSYVDCVSFVLMDARGTRTAFTFDEDHFVKVRKLKTWVPIPRARR